jgi:hypothetical protein
MRRMVNAWAGGREVSLGSVSSMASLAMSGLSICMRMMYRSLWSHPLSMVDFQ